MPDTTPTCFIPERMVIYKITVPFTGEETFLKFFPAFDETTHDVVLVDSLKFVPLWKEFNASLPADSLPHCIC